MIEFMLNALLCIILIISVISIYVRWSFKKCTSKLCMKGKVVIVTGANGGIGYDTAKNLAGRGARVILACRSDTRGNTARDDIVRETGNTDVIFRHLDLSSLKSVRQFTTNILQTENYLHVLVNNAGIHGFPEYTDDGIIEEMQVNYFSHFLLTLLLLPLLKKSSPSRIINLSSILHFAGSFNPDTINKRRILEGMLNYCNSKFCMLMFSVELSRRLEGTGVVANAVHPGVIMTNIASNGDVFKRFLFWCSSVMYNQTAEDGAQTVVHLAVDEECGQVSGKYYVDCASRLMLWKAKDEITARQLWEYSKKVTGYSESDF